MQKELVERLFKKLKVDATTKLMNEETKLIQEIQVDRYKM